MTSAPASGPMLCARCGERRTNSRTVVKRSGSRSNPDTIARRKVAQKFYSTPAWRRVRDQVRARDGECLDCGATKDLTVDHVIPRALAPELALEPANLRTLCRRCHGLKDGGRARHYAARRSPLTASQGASRVLREGGGAREGSEPCRGLYGTPERPPVVA